ncbi:MAG: recombinase RecA, partial [Anaerolineae bacterium]|nr:recombinase RecA [Anaerolineae bacterium]
MARKKKAEAAPLFDKSDKTDEGRQKALAAALEDLTRRFGEGTIMSLGEAAHLQVDVIPTGSLGVDIALGVGGIPRGRITEIYGAESSGKTTLCLHIIREAQRRGGICAFVDMEHALDPLYAGRIGVELDTLYVSQPDTAEQALEIVESLVRSGAMDVIVLDSVAALVPRAEIEGEMGDSHVGLQARLMSQALRKLVAAIKQSNVAVIFTNQLREKVGVMFGCMSADVPVTLADGSSLPISTIVEQKLPVEVLSYNVTTQQFEPRRVVNWFNNGATDHFLRFVVASYADGHSHTFDCTPNHLLLTEDGYVPAGELAAGERLIVAVPVPVLAGVAPAQPEYHPQAMTILHIDDAPLPANNHRY